MTIDKIIFGVIGIMTALMGEWHLPLQILLILIFLDIVIGTFKALYFKNFTSKEFGQGLFRKAGYFIVIIICFQIDVLMKNPEPIIRDVCIFFYIAVEGTSLLETLGQLGIPIPKFIHQRMKKLRDISDAEKIDIIKNEESKDNFLNKKK